MKPVRIPFLSGASVCASCWLLAAIALLLTVHPSIGSADMVLSEKTELVGMPMHGQNAPPKRSSESTTYLQGKRIRTETEGRIWVLDFEKDKLITINPADKTYTEMSLQDLKEAQKQAMEWMKGLRAQMEEKLKKK